MRGGFNYDTPQNSHYDMVGQSMFTNAKNAIMTREARIAITHRFDLHIVCSSFSQLPHHLVRSVIRTVVRRNHLHRAHAMLVRALLEPVER